MSSASDNASVSSNMFIGEYKYPDWFTHKTYSFYKKKLDHLARLRYIHTESAAYYDKQHFKLYAPSIIITGLSGVASFLASSSLFNDTTQTGLGIGVGVLASVSAMIQSAASAVDFSTKAKLHREAGEDYEKLMTKVEFEMEMPNEPEFIDNLETIILDIQNKCKYAAPRHIIEGYDNYLIRKNKKLQKLHTSKKSNKNTIINIPETINEKSSLVINETNKDYGSIENINNVNNLNNKDSHIINFINDDTYNRNANNNVSIDNLSNTTINIDEADDNNVSNNYDTDNGETDYEEYVNEDNTSNA